MTLCLVSGCVVAAEHVVHNACSPADRGRDDVPVDGLGDVGGLVADGVGDVLKSVLLVPNTMLARMLELAAYGESV